MKNTYWEDKVYSQGKSLNKYPYDSVVSFISNYHPKEKGRWDIHVLEVGCGAGNNLWFAAKEGFQVTGIDGSTSAIEFAKNRFKEEGLKGVFLNRDFTQLPLEDNQYDLVIDRAAITCCGWEDIKTIISEIYRVMIPSGQFMFNVYSDQHSSYSSGELQSNGAKTNITQGTLKGIQQVYFFNQEEISGIFPSSQWNMISCKHHEISEKLHPDFSSHAEWTVIVEKK